MRHTGIGRGVRPQDLGIGSLFERVRDAVVVAYAKTQRIILWNPAAEKMFGYSPSEALEMRVEALVPGSLKARHRAGIARYAETGHGPLIDSDTPLDLPALRKDGQEIRVELSLSPVGLVDATDDPVGGGRFVLAIICDATERRRAEEAIQRLNETLEARVAERTAQRARTGLQQMISTASPCGGAPGRRGGRCGVALWSLWRLCAPGLKCRRRRW
jgi:PAS domain S-box-containing protein